MKINSREILRCGVFAKISSHENLKKKKVKIFLRKLVPAKINSLKVLGAAPYGREQSTSCGSHLLDFSAWTVGSWQELGMIMLVT